MLCSDPTVRRPRSLAVRRAHGDDVGRNRRALRLEPACRRLLDGLSDGLRAAAAGCRQVWLDGSFVTSKDEPADFDACWDLEDVDLDRLDPVLLNLSAGRRAQKARCGGEFFPNVVEAGSGLVFADFFQNDRDTGRKGIVVIHPEEELL
jgi:hypothetical protein